MQSLPYESPLGSQSPFWRAATATAHFAWNLMRLPVLAVLVAMEPVVYALLWLFSALGVLGALFYRFVVGDPRFPFWGTLALSAGLALLAGMYSAIIRILGGAED